MNFTSLHPSKHCFYLFSPFFYPEEISTGRYNTYLAQALVQRGFHVEVISFHPLFPSWRVQPTQASLVGMSIHRGGSWLFFPSSYLLRRLILELSYGIYSLKYWLVNRFKRLFSSSKSYSKYEPVIIAIFPPSLFFALVSLVLPSSIRRVGIVHDLQSVYISNHTLLHRIIAFAIHLIEKRAFHSCQKLIFLSNSMMRKAVQTYELDPTRVFVSHPFVTLPYPPSSSPEVDRALDPQQINIVYSGALGDKQEPDLLVRFMSLLHTSDSRLKCHIFSAGPHFDRLRTLDSIGVSFHDLVPSSQLSTLYSRSFVQIIPQAFGTSDGSLPSKLPNLLAAGVPIFAICEPASDLGILVHSFGAGCVCHSWNPHDLVDTFLCSWPVFTCESHEERRQRYQPMIDREFGIDSIINQIVSA